MSEYINIGINLSKDNISFKDKFVNFGLGYGFIIILVATTIVIGGSIFKIKTDNQLIILNKSIANMKVDIENNLEFEKEFNLTQEKISLHLAVEERDQINLILPKISLVMPENVILDSLVINQKEITFNGTSLSQEDITYLYNNILMITQKNPDIEFSSFDIDKIENKDAKNSGYDFSLSFNYKIKNKYASQ